MNVHRVILQGYEARAVPGPGPDPTSAGVMGLYLGTAGSYGQEQLLVIQTGQWETLSVTAVFQPCGVKVMVPAGGGAVDVPWEATAEQLLYPQGRVVFQGFTEGELVNSCDLVYTVSGHSATDGADPQPPTPDQYQQFVAAVRASAEGAAGSAAAAAESAGASAASAQQAEGSAAAAADSAAAAAGAAQAASGSLDGVRQGLQEVQNARTGALTALADGQAEALRTIQDRQQAAVQGIQSAQSAAAAQVAQAGGDQKAAVQAEGAAQVQAVRQASDDTAAAQIQAVEQAGRAQADAVRQEAGHYPQPNTANGLWQVWDIEAGRYQDTAAPYHGGYYTPAVDSAGNLTWTPSQESMPAAAGTNIRGPQGPQGEPGPAYTLTQQDKDAMVQAVLSALPDGDEVSY